MTVCAVRRVPVTDTSLPDPLAAARYALEHFRHYDVPGSLADLYDALHPNTKETQQ